MNPQRISSRSNKTRSWAPPNRWTDGQSYEDERSELRLGQSAPFLRIDDDPDREPLVHICAVAVAGVDASAPLLSRLNEINSLMRFARIFWTGNQVLIESEMPGSGVCFDAIYRAYETVGRAASYFGPLLAEEFENNLERHRVESSPALDSEAPGFYL